MVGGALNTDQSINHPRYMIAIQEILMWQYRTMEMMYSKIGQAIKDYGSDCHPTDYLSFYCLAKRESPDEVFTYLSTKKLLRI